MRNSNGFVMLIIVLIFWGFFDDGVNKVDDVSISKEIAVEHEVVEKEILVDGVWLDGKRRVIHEGDVHTANFQVDLVHGGYVGTGPATEIIRTIDSFSYPNKYFTGNNGLVTNAGINEYYIQLNSVFGENYDCYISTRYILDRAIVRNKKGQGQLYLAKVEWEDNKTLSVVLNLTTNYELEQLDKALFETRTF